MQRSAQLARSAFGIARRRFGQRVGIEFDDGIQRRAGIVERRDPSKVGAGQRLAVEFARGHARLELRDSGFLDSGLLEPGRRCAHGEGRQRCQQQRGNDHAEHEEPPDSSHEGSG